MKKPKVLAIYLPQCHRIKENDEWWGKGFTEWNVVRNAKKISKYNIQPRVPLMGYYDLSKKDDINKQALLAKKYNIDGFLMYMYYSNGELLLEKPMQIILNNPDIEIEYCFSWANHDWKRTWFEYNTEMLRKQEYGETDEQIEQHFNYMLPYFKDKRYIKKDNKPVFYIYDYNHIKNIRDYKRIWNDLAIKNGFDGIFLVQTLGGHCLEWNNSIFEACFDFEPTYTTSSNMKYENIKNKFRRLYKRNFKNKKIISNVFDYDKVCNQIENRECTNPNHNLGIFAEWDNSPRHKDNSTIFKNFSVFKKDFLIIDAWNEWGEGAFIEPDHIFDYGKLESISDVIDKFK